MLGFLTLLGATTNPADQTKIDDVLDALHQRSGDLKEFAADVKQVETDDVMGTSTTKTGKIWYQVKADGDPRIRILFEKKAIEDKPAHDDRREYLIDNGWVTDRDYPARNEVSRQVARPGQKLNLFQLGKGPMPLPIGQDKKDVHGAFDVTLIAPAGDDPPDTTHLQLKPRADTDLARKFTSIDVWVDHKNNMPVRVETLDAKQASDSTIDLLNLKINPQPGLKDTDFVLPTIDSGWNRHDEPFQD